jgi:hypothetical protein
VIQVILDARNFLRLGDYYALIHAYSIAQTCFIKYMKWADPQMLKEYYSHHDMFEELAYLSLQHAKNTSVSSPSLKF